MSQRFFSAKWQHVENSVKNKREGGVFFFSSVCNETRRDSRRFNEFNGKAHLTRDIQLESILYNSFALVKLPILLK